MSIFQHGRQQAAPLFLSLLATTSAFSDDIVPYTKFNSFAYSEAVSISDFIDDWQGDYQDGSIALVNSKLEVGIEYSGLQLSFFKKYNYELKFSKDTAEFYYQNQNKKPLDMGRTYQLNIEPYQTYSKGTRLGYQHYFPEQRLSLQFGISYLQGKKLTTGKLYGTAIANSDKDYDFLFNVDDYFYSEDRLFERPIEPTEGHGYSFDATLNWRITPKLFTQIELTDLMGRIYWKNAPYTTAAATSDTKQYDDEGYLAYKPVLSGVESNRNFTQRLPLYTHLQLGYQLPLIDLIVKTDHTAIKNFTSFGINLPTSKITQWQFFYNVTAKALSMGYSSKYFSANLISDSINPDKAHTLGLSLALTLPL